MAKSNRSKHLGLDSGKSSGKYFTQGSGNPHAGTGAESGVSGAIAKGIKLIFRTADGKKQK